ncbi:DNA repair protein RadC [Kamptonema cortianum]|nr:DNA repair protein RadC [Geitlerinema splendidum]MDK3158722.1 DNA repair protein RadC [Kamptonema cortianum]
MEINPEDALSRVKHQGLRSVSYADLVSLILSREERDVQANETQAAAIVKRFPGHRLVDIGHADLNAAAGLEAFESLRLLAALELGRRAAGQGKQPTSFINNQEDAFRVFQHLASEVQEHFCAAFLSSKAGIISTKTIHIGTINMSVVGPREVFREAVRESAASIVVAHNHPSGDPTPSPEDIAITKKLAEVGELLNIPLLDHVIIGQGRYVSLRKEGVI